MNEKTIKARFLKDTGRKHRFEISDEDGITGSIYIPKEMDLPKILTVQIVVRGEE